MSFENAIEIYNLLERITEIGFKPTKGDVPKNGVYFAYEKGENVSIGDKVVQRIVRVGSHHGQGNLPSRLSSHYGQTKSLKGNSSRSVFRKLIGAALLERDKVDSKIISEWLDEIMPAEIEEAVSNYLRTNITFRSIIVEEKKERLAVESYLIGNIANYRVGNPSVNWLGNHSHCPKVRQYGIWNRKDTDISALRIDMWSKFISAIKRTYEYYGIQL